MITTSKKKPLGNKIVFGPPRDIRGKWLLQIEDPGQSSSKLELYIFFPGTQNDRKFEVLADPDNPELRHWFGSIGEYRVSSTLAAMKIEVGDELYYFNGNINSSNTISGSYSYDTGDSPRRRHGPWTATRIE
jgi:hypothetical protein